MNILDDLFNNKSLDEMKIESYEESKLTKENASYWFPLIDNSTTKGDSSLLVPETKIVQLDFEHWDLLTTDKANMDITEKLNIYLKRKLGNFRKGETLFLKTGIFSNKFEFSQTQCNVERTNLGQNLKDMYYFSMVVGAYKTTEAVFRENILSKEDVPEIYDGMPLHTEFRVFYDFDNKELVGVSNYWNPELMTSKSLGEDYEEYKKAKGKIVCEYENDKFKVAEEVMKFMAGVSGFQGKWSVDIMKNGNDYWLIDMSRMEYSSLREVMEGFYE